MTEIKVGGMLEQILGGLAAELRRGQGPVKWCGRCGRKHPRRRPCGLVKVAVRAKSGRMVERLVHPDSASKRHVHVDRDPKRRRKPGRPRQVGAR